MNSVKLKNAPNLNKQPIQAIYEELIILAGSKAWTAWDSGKGLEWDLFARSIQHNKKQPPVILGTRQLKELDGLRLAEEERESVKIAIFGELNNAQKTAICYNLAKFSKIKNVHFLTSIGELEEDATAYIQRLRTDDSSQESARVVSETLKEAEPIINFKENPKQKEIARAFLEWSDNPIRQDRLENKVYEFNGLYWQELPDTQLQRKVLEFYDAFDGDYSARRLNEIAKLIGLVADELPPQSPDLIGFKNGVLNKKTGQFEQIKITDYLRGIEHFSCDNTCTATPHFDNWLNFVCEDNPHKKNAILAGLYMVMTNRHEWGLFLEATGTAGAGKSVLARIATIINGSANTATISLKEFEDEKSRSILIGKTLAYSPDQKPYIGSADELKAMTGGDPLKVRLLYANALDVKINAVFLMTTNYPILFTDRNGGIARRRVIIPFDKAIPKEKKDVNFIDKVQGEVYALVNRLLALFPDPNTARAILEDYQERTEGLEIKREANHLIDFLGHFELREERSRSKGALRLGSARSKPLNMANIHENDTLYSAYLFYCDCHDINGLNVFTFKKALADAFKEAGEKIPYSVKMNKGIPTTNAYWKDRELSISQWLG